MTGEAESPKTISSDIMSGVASNTLLLSSINNTLLNVV